MKRKPKTSCSKGSIVSSSSGNGHLIGRTTARNAIMIGRMMFLSVLMATAAAFGTFAYYTLESRETASADSHFQSICDQLLAEALAMMERKRLGTLTMASVVAYMNPKASQWPFVTVPGFEVIASNVIATSFGLEMGVAPIVTPDQLEEFESFIYAYFETKQRSPLSNGTVTSSFGTGVWGFDPTLNTTDHRYRISNGSKAHGSRNDIIVPLIAHNEDYSPSLMFDLHSERHRGLEIDRMIECCTLRAASDDPDSIHCGMVTDILDPVDTKHSHGPGAVLMQPIFPAENSTTLVGISMLSFVWEDLLQIGSTYSETGIDCVITTGNQIFTYHVSRGAVELRGRGDYHDRRFDRFMTSKNLTSGIDYYISSPMYTLTLYPTSTLYESFRTDNPSIAAVGAILIILFTSMLFFLYDFLVRREFNSKDRLLESKRSFVRFVSHEVRTPLNSVAMGLSLLQDGCAFALGYRTSDEMLKDEDFHSQSVPNTITNTNMITSPTQIDQWRTRTSEWFYLVNEIQNNVESSIDVLNDLLNYDKIETGALSLELTTILIWKLIQKTANEFISPLAKKKISFKLLFTDLGLSEFEQTESIHRSDISLLLPLECKKQRVIGDTVRLTQVFRNLISNAVKFTKEGGEISVRASWIPLKASAVQEKSQFILKCGSQVMASSCGYIKVKVKDSGAGMSKEQLSQLFQHGVQFNVNELQAGQGSGLGLYIAKGILEGHQGRLYANSEGLGLGSTFTLEIPMYVIDGDKEDTLDCEGTEASFLFSEPSSFRILVVDDSLSNRKLLCRILTNKGHYVEEADDGSEAVAKVKQSLSENRSYDTILLDYEMPIMNGPDAAVQIRALGCDSFIVGVTGNMLPEDVAYFRSCGANALLGKPFKMKSLEDLWYEHNHSSFRLIDNTV